MTPLAEKIEKIIKQQLYEDPINAGRLASRMEVGFCLVFAGDCGKLRILDGDKVSDIIIGMYRRKVKDVRETVDKCRQVILEALRKINLKENKEAYYNYFV